MMKSKISQALLEVWELKDICYNEVKDLPIEKALEKRIQASLTTVKNMKIELSPLLTRLESIKNKQEK